MAALGAVAAAAAISLRPVCAANVNAVIQLAVHPSQAEHVATNAVTLAQAAFEPESWLRAIYAGPVLVGLLLLSGSPAAWPAFLSRLMIAEPHQRRGLGASAVAAVVAALEAAGCPALHVSYSPAEDGPRGFYTKLGFEEAPPSARAAVGEPEVYAVLRLAALAPAAAPEALSVAVAARTSRLGVAQSCVLGFQTLNMLAMPGVFALANPGWAAGRLLGPVAATQPLLRRLTAEWAAGIATGDAAIHH